MRVRFFGAGRGRFAAALAVPAAFLLSVIVSGSAAQAQVTLLTDNFNAETVTGTSTTTLANFNVLDGTVEVLGPGFFNFYPGNGNYLDLDGGTFNAARLESKTLFTLDPGDYTLSFSLGTNGAGNSMLTSVGSVFSETFTTAQAGAQPTFATITRNFTVLSGTTGRIIFDHAGGDNGGLVLDNVTLTFTAAGGAAAPEPGTLGLLLLGGVAATGVALRRRASK